MWTGFETKGASQRIEVPSVDVRSIIEIRRITVAVHIYARQPHADHIPDRDVDHATRFDAVEIAILELRFSLETGEFGFRGHNIHDPGGRIPAEQGALRSAKRSEEHTSELQSLMRISYAVFCLTNT